MPELPEVETVARQLAPRLVGSTVRTLRIYDPRLTRTGRPPALAGRRIEEVVRSGKRVLIGFSARGRSAPLWLAVHLRMTGRLLLDAAPRGRMEHLRARMALDRGVLLFVDPRRFGTFTWYTAREASAPAGQEPLDPALTAAGLEALLGSSAQPLKTWLLRQDRLVGLGNIYASEILHDARLSPLRAAGSLGPAEAVRLHRAIRKVLERAIRHNGTTFSDFQDAEGVNGRYQRLLAVYDRADRPCRRCGRAVRRVVQQQRSTFYCSGCQH